MRRTTKAVLTPRLFDMMPTPSRVEDVPWSHARRSTLEECAQKYFQEYYGADYVYGPSEVGSHSRIRLKDVQNRYLRTGAILHLAIAQYFRQLRDGKGSDEAGLVQWARRIFREDRVYSAEYPNQPNDARRPAHPPELILEYLRRVPDVESLCDEAEERMVGALTRFMSDRRYGAFRFGATHPNAVIERGFTLRTLPCRVAGKLDLAFPVDERIVIVDWKLGADRGTGEESLQLAVYALWALDHYQCTVDAIEVYKAHLSSGEVVPFRVDARVLANARARIVQDAITMAALDRYGEQGIAEAFSPSPEPFVCRLCPFVPVCPGGQEILNA